MAARILCVDDEHDICRLLDTILTMSGYRTLVAGTAAEGLSRIQLQPDLIILDLNLPDLDGIEMCRQVRRIDARVPVLFLTAATDARRAEALAAGGNAFLEKPFDVDELLGLIAGLLALAEERRTGRDRRVRGGIAAAERRAAERRAPVLHAAPHARASNPPAPRPMAHDPVRARRPAPGEPRRGPAPERLARAPRD